MLKLLYKGCGEAGCDEAGRGCLAGPVVAAAVIINPDVDWSSVKDSKKLNAKQRMIVKEYIEKYALDWAVAFVDNLMIDQMNILQASIKAMHLAIEKLALRPSYLLIDGNRFIPYKDIPHTCLVKGDAHYTAIAAASILAKTYRDQYMLQLHKEYPHYNWEKNKGYPTAEHRRCIMQYGLSPYHRKSFDCYGTGQLTLDL